MTMTTKKHLIDDRKDKSLMSGIMDKEKLFIEPILIQFNEMNEGLITDGSFALIITIHRVEHGSEAIQIEHQVQRTSLAIYSFDTKARQTGFRTKSDPAVLLSMMPGYLAHFLNLLLEALGTLE